MTFFLPEYGVYLSAAALYTTFAALIMTLFRRITGSRFKSGWRYAMSIILPVIVLFPLRFYFPWTLFELPKADMPLYIPSVHVQPSEISEERFFAASNYPSFRLLSLTDIVTLIILTAGIALFIREIIRNISLGQRIKKSGYPQSSRIREISERLCLEMKLRPVPIIICGLYESPFAMGIIRPRIVLPTEDYSDCETEYILRHELIHIKRRDVLLKLFLLIFKCLNWYNPLAHLLYKQACEDMEISCDEAACKAFSAQDRQGYCETILKGITKGKYPAMTTCLGAGAMTMKKRLAGVLEEHKIGNLLPFFGTFICILMFTLFAIVTPTPIAGYDFVTEYPKEKGDLSLSEDSWKTCTADSYNEAAEKIFRQYMALYMGEDVPDYQRIEDYSIEEIYSHDDNFKQNMTSSVKRGLLNSGKTVYITYSFVTANKTGNTVHNTNRGIMNIDGLINNAELDMAIKQSGKSYTLQSMGISCALMRTDRFHFSTSINSESGGLNMKRWQAMAESGLLDETWNKNRLPSPEALVKYDIWMLSFAGFAEYFRIGEIAPEIYALTDTDEYMERTNLQFGEELKKIEKKNVFDSPKKFEYCGYNADFENGSLTVFGNVTDENGAAHGIILSYAEINSEPNLVYYELTAAEKTENTFTPVSYKDSFENIELPPELYSDDIRKTAENILEYMKTPRDNTDFTVLDYKNITVKHGMAFAEVKFKGRLCGKYSSELPRDEYTYVRVCAE